MNRRELTVALAQRSGVPEEQADALLTALGDVLVEAVAGGDDVRLPGVLSVERVERAARTGRNPRTGETLQIAAAYGVRISPGTRLKAAAGSSAPA
ncbi:DNA-binding protein HU-beta [Kineococcus xinjiangensis]|uniref:DNA-binding protein HU-beta n=1 Tax=Kineococcus xinjiangensis TaxID=512762 RepID=A0A2S6II50_9ACTN|nr:HU family DNA-binding protein [Kineococcus xinjiangensis]PPK93868.1 DNA-binding protein HU-beta [Kineococcus xinjiangensis]